MFAVTVVIALTAAYEPTAEWRAAIVAHDPGVDADLIAWRRTPLSPAESAWVAVAESRRHVWQGRLVELAKPFRDSRPLPEVRVLLGRQGADDGFTFGPTTICFDLDALVRVYGSGADSRAAVRLDRLFTHEYTHLLHKRWLSTHPQAQATSLSRALWEAAYEGLATYQSLSGDWVTPSGALTPLARQTLAGLAPTLVARLEALGKAQPAEEDSLRRGLSTGPFRDKWGALPVALWLAAEAQGDATRVRSWVDLGGNGVLVLACRHLLHPDQLTVAACERRASPARP